MNPLTAVLLTMNMTKTRVTQSFASPGTMTTAQTPPPPPPSTNDRGRYSVIRSDRGRF